MILEFQVAAEVLRQSLLSQIREREFCVTDHFDVLGDSYVLDHIDILDSSTLARASGQATIHRPGGDQTINASVIQYVQPVVLNVTKISTLEANGKQASTPDLTPTITLTFELTMKVHAGVPQLRFKLASVDAGIIATLDPNAAALIQQKVQIDQTTDMDLSSVESLLGTTVTAQNAGAVIDANASRVSLRIELHSTDNTDDSDDTVAVWTDFFTGSVTDLRGNNDFGLLLDKDLIVPVVKQKIVGGGLSSGDFTVDSSVSASWDTSNGPAVIVTFHGSQHDACVCFFVPIDVGVDVTITVDLSVPKHDVLRLETNIATDLDDAAVACCAITGFLFWPIVGLEMIGEGSSGWGEYFGGLALGPLAVFIGIIAMASSQSPNVQTPANCSKISDTEFRCDQPVDLQTGLGNTTLTGISARASGPVMTGSMALTVSAGAGKLKVDEVDEFAWGLAGSCNAGFGPAIAGYIYLSGARTVCSATILDDPDGCYSCDLEQNQQDPSWVMPHVTITPDMAKVAAEATPYPCKVLIITDGGARVIQLKPPKAITASQQQQLEIGAIEAKGNCDAAVDPFWGKIGKFNPKWSVDPGPEGVYEHIWDIVATGLTASEQVIAQDHAGAVIAVATPTARGLAEMSVSTAPLAAGNELTLSRGEAGAAAHAVTEMARHAPGPAAHATTARELMIRQVLLSRRSTIVLSTRASHLTAGAMHNVPWVVAVTEHGVRAFDVSTCESPLAVQTVAASGLRGAMIWNDRLVVWGEGGLASLAPGDSRVGLPARPRLAAAVYDAVRVGPNLAVLTTDGVELFDAGLRSVSRLAARGATSLLAVGRRLVATGRTEVQVFDLSKPQAPRADATLAATGAVSFAGPSSHAAAGTLFSRNASGGGAVIDVAGGKLTELVTYHQDPWFLRTARLGRTIARLETQGLTIAILRIAKTYQH